MYYPILSKGNGGFKSFRLEKCQAGPGRYGSHSLTLLLQSRPISVELTPSCSFCTHDASHLYKCTIGKVRLASLWRLKQIWTLLWRLEQIYVHFRPFCHHSLDMSLGGTAPCSRCWCRQLSYHPNKRIHCSHL